MSPSVATRENREYASEVKFLVAPERAEQIRAWARHCLGPDPHAGGRTGDTYRITSLYFDTRDFDVFNRRGSYGRSKYRIRRYGASEVVFLERKLKTKRLVTKRRCVVPMERLDLLGGSDPGWPGWWFQARLQLRGLAAVAQISYERTARVAMTQWGPIRLTVDQDLRAVPVNGPVFTADWGTLLSDDFAVIEMKFRFAVPAVFKHLIGEFALNPVAFSKYRFAAAHLGLVADRDPLPSRNNTQHALAYA